MRYFAITLFIFLSGCADAILTKQEAEAFGPNARIINPGRANNLEEAAQAANQLAYAYFTAAREAQAAQDVASASIILAAAGVVAGTFTGASDTTLATAGIGAVGAQQVASRGVSKATIESIYDGAQILNCIGAVATIYQADRDLKIDPRAAEITLSVIREVRIAARSGLTREVADYSTIVGAFSKALPDDGTGQAVLGNFRLEPGKEATPSKLETYLTRMGGCTTSKSASQSNDQSEPGQPQ